MFHKVPFPMGPVKNGVMFSTTIGTSVDGHEKII
jgi:hypothetical protein